MKQRYFLVSLFCLLFCNTLIKSQSVVRNDGFNDTKDWFWAKNTESCTIEEWKDKIIQTNRIGSLVKLEKQKQDTDQLDYTHHRYQQKYKDIPVEGAICVIHEKEGEIVVANAKLVEGLNLEVKPKLSESEALEKALNHINAQKYAWEDEAYEELLKTSKKDIDASFCPQAELIITSPYLNRKANEYRLAYKFDIHSLIPHQRYWVYIDAHTGDLLMKRNQICQMTTKCTGPMHYSCDTSTSEIIDSITVQYDDGNYSLETDDQITCDGSNGLSNGPNDLIITPITSTTCHFEDTIAASIHRASEQVMDYFTNQHNRNSYDNSGAVVISFAHFNFINEFFFPNNNNAAYNGYFFLYGDGDNNNPYISIDIIAHEFTHAINTHMANLVLYGEPGALGESFSDIFGVIIEHYINPDCANWLMGEQVTGDGLGIRNLANPNAHLHPDTYRGAFWRNTESIADNGGIHINCGVQNHWFYLLVEGGIGPNGHPVIGIGMEKAAAIVYRNLTTYLSSTSDYIDARNGSIQAARDLYGNNSMEAAAVNHAWCAVGICSLSGDQLEITSPNGGEVLIQGTTIPIEWTASGGIDSVEIAYSINEGLHWIIIESAYPNTGIYQWEVPNICTNKVVIKITKVGDITILDRTDDLFSIECCQVISQFQASNLSSCEGDSVCFNNRSVDGLSYQWEIDGVIVSNEENYQVLFDTLGDKLVCLSTFGENCHTSYCQTIYVEPMEPTVAFTYIVDHNTLSVIFEPLFEETINTLVWYWGDEVQITDADTASINHIYTNVGEYIVCLVGTNDCGGTEYCEIITVGTQDTVMNCSSEAVTAYFSYNTTPICLGDSRQFINQSSVNASSFEWWINEELVSTVTHCEHIFDEAGYYIITLIAYDENDCISEYQEWLEVRNEVLPNFSATVNGLTVTLTVDEFQTNTSYEWIFPDGTREYGYRTSYTFDSSGIYTVTLNAAQYCSFNTVNQEIEVEDLLVTYQKLFRVDHNSYIIINDVIETDDGLIFSGYVEDKDTHESDILVGKLKGDGALSWSHLYGGIGDDLGTDLCKTNDGGVAIIGSTTSFNPYNKKVYVLKLDAEGNEQWSIVLDEDQYEEGISITQTPDEGFIISGRSVYVSGEPRSVFLIKLNASGQKEWGKDYHTTIPSVIDVKKTIITNDGGYALLGIQSQPTQPFLIKLDDIGNINWSYTFDNINPDYSLNAVNDIISTEDNGFLIVGSTRHTISEMDMQVLKLDANGSLEWSKVYGGQATDGGAFSSPTYNQNQFLITGMTNSFTDEEGDWDIYLILINEEGEELWSKTYGGEQLDIGKVIALTDGTFAIVGIDSLRLSTAVGNSIGTNNGYLIKTDKSGRTSCFQEEVNSFCRDITASIVRDTIALLTTMLNAPVRPVFSTIESVDLEMQLLCGAVYPGDFNYDGIVDYLDLLTLGRSIGYTGFSRPNASFDFQAQACKEWEESQPNGSNFKHIDGDGNGLIDARDLWAITQNYGKSHNYTIIPQPAPPTFIDLRVEQVNRTYNGGNTASFVFNVILDNELSENVSLYGLLCEVDASIPMGEIRNVSMKIPEASFLGEATEIMKLANYDSTNNSIHLGLSRMDLQNQTGTGILFEMHIDVDIANIPTSDSISMRLIIDDMQIADNVGELMPIRGINSHFSLQAGDESSCGTASREMISHTIGREAAQKLAIFISETFSNNLKEAQYVYIKHQQELNRVLAADDLRYNRLQSLFENLKSKLIDLLKKTFLYEKEEPITRELIQELDFFLLELTTQVETIELKQEIEKMRESLFILEEKPFKQALVDWDQADLNDLNRYKQESIKKGNTINCQMVNGFTEQSLLYCNLLEANGLLKVSIYNLNGQLIKVDQDIRNGLQTLAIDKSDLPEQLYIVQVEFDNGQALYQEVFRCLVVR